MKNLKLWFGYCERCERWFVYPKKRRQSTTYENDSDNFTTCCMDCYLQGEEYWSERYEEYYRGLM